MSILFSQNGVKHDETVNYLKVMSLETKSEMGKDNGNHCFEITCQIANKQFDNCFNIYCIFE